MLVGYFNRNTKQEFDIPAGPEQPHRGDQGGPDKGQPTHFLPGRQWGLFSIALPKDFGNKKATWTIVANGFTNTVTLHTQADYIVEPFGDAANKNTPPVLKFRPDGQTFTGAPKTIAEKYTATVGTPLALTVWATDEGPKINIPEPRGRGRGARARRRGRPRRAGHTGRIPAAAAAGAHLVGLPGGRGRRGEVRQPEAGHRQGRRQGDRAGDLQRAGRVHPARRGQRFHRRRRRRIPVLLDQRARQRHGQARSRHWRLGLRADLPEVC